MVTDKSAPMGVEGYFNALQEKMIASLGVAQVMSHPVAKGDEVEVNWFEMLEQHLPKRYQVIQKCFVVDYLGAQSEEIDLALCDRQYSTLVLKSDARVFVPAESVYAVLEVKPRLNREYLLYAAAKTASVRRLVRTNAPIVHALGCIETPREPCAILGGLLTTTCDWTGPDSSAFITALKDQEQGGQLTLGCSLQNFGWAADYSDSDPVLTTKAGPQSLIFFYLSLLKRLQAFGTVPAMDLEQWGSFLKD